MRVLDVICGSHAQAMVGALLALRRGCIAARSGGLIELLSRWIEQPPSFQVTWHLVFGGAERAGKCDVIDPLEVAAGIGLRLTEVGCPGGWQASFDAATLRFGPWILRDVNELSVNEAGQIAVRTSVGEQFSCWRDEASAAWHADGFATPPSVGICTRIELLSARELPLTTGGPLIDGVQAVDAINPETVAAFCAAVDAVGQTDAAYAAWIEEILRAVVICPREDAFRAVSGSGETAPGLIHVSAGLGRLDIAEILVHESAHQWFYLLERAGFVDDGSDQRRYWSPPIRCERPLSRILMAYHALANVLLFYDLLHRQGGDENVSYVAAHGTDMAEAVAQLDVPLRGNPALTPLGRGLYDPLAQRIATLELRVSA